MTSKQEIAQELLELLVQAAPLAEQLARQDPAFKAYHLASLQGTDGGWLGHSTNFLIDAVVALAGDDDCEGCGECEHCADED